MKKLVIIFVLFSQTLSAQIYLNQTSTWNQKSGYTDFINYHYLSCKLYVNGDTIINTNVYHKIYSYCIDSVPITNPQPGQPPVFYDTIQIFNFSLREDSSSFYYINRNQSLERILYDFNVNIGDDISSWAGGSTPLLVTAIDTVYLGVNPRKRYFVGSKYYIEGVGSNTGLLGNLTSSTAIESGTTLVCFNQDNNTVMVDTTYSSCFSLLINYFEEINTLVNFVYPNPFTNTTTFEIENPDNLNLQFSVYDIFGQEVDRIGNIMGTSFIFDRKQLSNGLYLFYLSNENKIISNGKLLIQ
jgi:hypothetical protein